MYRLTGMKLLRLLTGRTLSSLGQEIGGYRRAHLSHAERDASEAGVKLQKRLCKLYGTDWQFLSKEFDGAAIAASIVKLYEVQTNA